MTSQGSALARFHRSVENGNPTIAFAAAAELPRLSLEDALALLRVLGAALDSRFERAAGRWLERFAAETSATLADVQLAAGALGQLRAPYKADLAFAVLDRLLD